MLGKRNKRSLEGSRVAVTGAARGIGLAIARELAHAGASVAIADLDSGLAADAAASVGSGAISFPVDVSDRGSFAAFLDSFEDQAGPLDVLVNNAGVMPLGEFAAEESATTEMILGVNLRGALVGSQLAAQRMVPRGQGHIVNLASIAGKVGLPGAVSYSASKHGVVGLSEALRLELRGTGVEVTCVMPATVKTELAAGVTPKGIGAVGPEVVGRAVRRVIEDPRFELFVPRRAGFANRAMSVVPRGPREALVRAFGGEDAFVNVDLDRRAGYNARLRD